VISPDVIHSWWIPALGGKVQAIPGHPNHLWFKANKPGSYEGQCAELCGVYHASMLATVVAEPQQSYENYISTTARQTIGKQEWSGVCATCHGNLGQGGYGPAIANNTLLTQQSALEGILENGFTGTQGAMPPVGKGWTNAQISALVAYVKKHIYKAAPLGATSGG
jgi:cytochrome c oxidase subunit 2